MKRFGFKGAVPTAACAAVSLCICLSINWSYSVRINDLEAQRTIYANRAQNWMDRAIQDEEIVDQLQKQLCETQRMNIEVNESIQLTYAGEFFCTAYCTERYKHICGTGTGITASGATAQAGITAAADADVFPFGTVLYIEDVGIRVVQDRGAAVQGRKLDIAVDTHRNALTWAKYGAHRVWIVEGDVVD